MLPKLLLSAFFATFLINFIDCQQMVALLRPSASNQSPSISRSNQQQGLSLEQQQQLLAQLAQLQSQQNQRQQPQPSQFFDPNQPLPSQYFSSQGQQQPQQQSFFNPQQFVVQPQQQQQPQQPPPQPQGGQGPQINWGKCPQLEPSDSEKSTKAQVITKCLESTPLPPNITRDTVETHREQIASCALRNEGWFTSSGGYDFTKAETEIRNKRLTKTIEDQVLGYHKQCKQESEQKFSSNKSQIIAQIQLYQACMDYFISDVCGIEVNEPEGNGSGF